MRSGKTPSAAGTEPLPVPGQEPHEVPFAGPPAPAAGRPGDPGGPLPAPASPEQRSGVPRSVQPAAEAEVEPVQPRARRQVLLGVGAVVAVSVIGVGYSVYALATDSPEKVRPAAGASRTATSSPAARPLNPQVAVPALDAPIFAAPAPWQPQPDAAAGTGRVDLDRAVQIDGHGALSRTGLTGLGFVVGQSRSWRSGGAVLLVLDYTFRDAKGAGGYVSYLRRSRDIDPAYRTRAVRGVPGAVGYDRGQGDGLTSSAAFATGRTAYLLVVQGSPPTGPAGDLAELARRQHAVATK